MFLVKQEQDQQQQPSHSSSSSSSNTFPIDAVSSSTSPYEHLEYSTQFWSLPPYVTS
jgi:hypothetical protein